MEKTYRVIVTSIEDHPDEGSKVLEEYRAVSTTDSLEAYETFEYLTKID